jgi:hypothetical protein
MMRAEEARENFAHGYKRNAPAIVADFEAGCSGTPVFWLRKPRQPQKKNRPSSLFLQDLKIPACNKTMGTASRPGNLP